MPLRLDIKRKLSNRSDRVKAVDFHPTEPWLLAALYNGSVHIWNHETQALVKSFEICELPVRAAKFIARKSWLVTGSDDMQIHVFNYNTHERVAAFDAHSDYIRALAVHHTQPYVISGSDDYSIKLWDWDKGWRNVMTFEGHTHFVMSLAFNPKDSNTFASAAMDRTVKVWSLASRVPNYTMQGHQSGVNWVDYFHGGDKPYLVSGADDKLVKVWDYQNKSCVQTLEGHTNNVTAVCFHPELPIIVSGSEDGTVRIWHANTYRLENTLNYGMERVWALAYLKGSNDLAFGYDEGTIAIKLGRDEPAVSMDGSGKIIWARHSEIQTAVIRGAAAGAGEDGAAAAASALVDGERLVLPVKDLGSCEIYPQTLQHSPNGRFVVVCGDGEYIIYTALAWRNKSFGQALDFVWSTDSNEYAIRESTSSIRLFKGFKEKPAGGVIKPSFGAEAIFGGTLLGVRSSSFVIFYDWDTARPVRRIDAAVRSVVWSESDLVAICGDESFFVLRFNREAFEAHVESARGGGGAAGGLDDGFEGAFDVVAEIPESVKTGAWVGDCFVFTSASNRLNYVVGGQVTALAHFDTAMFLLGYLVRDNRVVVCDKNMAVVSFALPLALVEYETAVLRGDMAHAASVLPRVPRDQHNKIARFLEQRGLKEEALAVATDDEHRFELAVQLGRVELAAEIAERANHESKWKALGDLALSTWRFGLAEQCLRRARDLEGLLLIHQASGNAAGIAELAQMARESGNNNIAFVCLHLLGQTEQCIDLLVATGRIAEAALFARTYAPSQVSRVVGLWKAALAKAGKPKAAEALADPAKYGNLFPDMDVAQLAEAAFQRRREHGLPPAVEFGEWRDSLEWNVVEQLKDRFPDGVPAEVLQHAKAEAAASPNGTNGGSPAKAGGAEAASPNGAAAAPGDEAAAALGDKMRHLTLADGERPDASDNASHMSLEVNTTGTGSLRGDVDFDDLGSLGGAAGTQVPELDDDEIDALLA
ncbi:Coatomer subunit beta' [Polyrhizophydium stewartii]|uniref:Coatomer subunit beta' n=1 Tax=Polyrhizophydium stewartii TaxID=2732419 RepID=A0ABR4MVV8_9FUNG